ncbi:MAG: sigma-54 dependent transcriptional regulator [Candidatus Aminicenantes bacterium]|nr:sigma-54 dependent transcriptional regulator [Candidatus Aminicenantes bacterium]MDH5385735.1 sigma-54 dependent transcriptional regulator [Candidatus Aminicenantes bacterium]MDH5744287.1 sigma-54 dependent transcriptional regulator [Candidatus Aminicenantes bacterium]
MNKKTGKILIIDDDEDILQAARLLLKQHVSHVHTEKTPEVLTSLLKNEVYDVIFLDMNFAKGATSGQEGFHWLDKIHESDPNVVVVLITAFGDVDMAVRAIKEGATDFILKPWQNERLIATLTTALNLRKSRTEASKLRSKQRQLIADLDQPFHDFIGESPAMDTVFSSIQKVAKTDANVLILGENGTGKELVARELHRQSIRADEVFISVDMGALSETLFESELFGHVKGAFTDAKEDRAGRFEIASGGTLFLDEIGNLPLTLQAKLLTVLENRKVIRLGSNKPLDIDVRLICATNMPIHEMIAQNRFRQDLLYRVNTVEIRIPPLRERIGDILALMDHFLKIYCKKYNKPLKRLSSATLKRLEKYHWPGNVRELQHAIERAVIMIDSQVLQPTDFFFPIPEQKGDSMSFEDYNLEEIEKLVIHRAIGKHGGNITHAAKELGLSRASLYRRLEKYGL